LTPKNMQENLREFSKKTVSAIKKADTYAISDIKTSLISTITALKAACVKAINVRKNYTYLLIPVILFLFVGIIARTQEEPFQVNDLPRNNEETEAEPVIQNNFTAVTIREIPSWVRPARWFRSNSGGMPLEEIKSKTAALRGQYALVIDFTSSEDLPEYLSGYYDENYFIEIRTLFKDGEESRVQWIFRDENYGARLVAVFIEPEQEAEQEDKEAAPAGNETAGEAVVSVAAAAEDDTPVNADVIQNTDGGGGETAEVRGDVENKEKDSEIVKKTVKRHGPAGGFIEIYDEKYHLTTEYRYSEKGENSRIEYSYNNGVKVGSRTFLWDDDGEDYVLAYTDYYRYNRSSFLRAVERVFLTDQVITTAENVIGDGDTANNTVKISFPQNILAAARNSSFTGERFNEYPEFFGGFSVTEGSKLIYSTDKNGKVLEQTLVKEDGEQTVIWKIENTWSGDRIVKITKTEGETVYLAEYEYNKNGDRILERNIKDGVLERVVRSEGKTDIEELYQDDKLVLKAVWEDGRKISESRVYKN
jgi:hypothetical protein